MNNKILAMLSLTLLLSSPVAALAADLGADMDILAANNNAALKASNPDALKQALAAMHAAALDARERTPAKLKGQPADSAQMKDFRQGMTTLVGQIEQAQGFAEKGDIAGAQTVVKQFKQTRDANHAKFR